AFCIWAPAAAKRVPLIQVMGASARRYHPLADSIASPALKAATFGRLSCMPTLTVWQVPQGQFSGNGRSSERGELRNDRGWPESQHYTAPGLFLHHRLGPVFQRFFHLVQELVRDGAIHHAMVVAQCYVAHRTDGDGIVDHYRALLNRSQT